MRSSFLWLGKGRLLTALLSVAVAVAAGAACNMGAPGSPGDNAGGGDGRTGGIPHPGPGSAGYMPPLAPFAPDNPYTYVAKVKNILVGLPVADAEVKQVIANPDALKTLILGWMQLPDPNNGEGMTYYQEKMLVFFKLAFQQTQVTTTDFGNQTFPQTPDLNRATQNLLLQNLTESFARTMLALTSSSEDQPLNMATQTTSLMMTPALMEFYAFLDTWEVDDDNKITDGWGIGHPKQAITIESSGGAIALSDTLMVGGKEYMHWYDPDLSLSPPVQGAGCGQDPIVYSTMKGNDLHYFLYGTLPKRTNPSGGACDAYSGTSQMTTSDFTTWKMVSIRQPTAGEPTTAFYDLDTIRSATELVLNIPRVGFFSTPAFAANWQTNASNQMRVTMNQTLIVALGAMMDGTDTTVPQIVPPPGLDATHAQPSTKCYACHQLLDPMRSIFAANYSWNYHTQLDDTYTGTTGLFAFGGVTADKSDYATLADLGGILAKHPDFATGWVQKLSYYVNSQANDPTDPEFLRIVGDFKKNNYSWGSLVVDLLTSPLTTNSARTQTTSAEGVVAAVARRDHFCAALNFRLGFQDVCDLLPTTTLVGEPGLQTLSKIAGGLPSDGYGRGSTVPVLPNQPSLFFRAGTESMCEAVAALVIDTPPKKLIPGVKQWSSTDATSAITDFVQIIMGITPSNPIYGDASSILEAHYTSALTQTGIKPTEALQSTFTAACLSPSFVGVGLQ
jgi:hypothetical protein